ncbi:uncharacterized protein CANTADRAFT_8443 [Suhomyces tanzawaensis NRRL Y-17324]|uniref:Uncharacterized protein n=1 Tax=Suhomyces tanzawaensis NRRL Y-17324 TaxID=984487 RepID=A0A1E4SBI1_9ASCO|nr:uncharacterized protein CANTADRAFT_8443 [Suhomyces tanzawaensis NRRL Y-17324]ODV76863.1 hypothetical protein CANTADRAFT_8443 [Suhomyces tanzawaensis NRRL Y-17324]
MTDTVDIPVQEFYEAIVVGGGTCGLAMTSRLCEECPGSIYTEDEHQRFHWLKQRGNRVNLINHNVSSKTKYKPVPGSRLYKPKKKFEPEEILVLDAVSDSFMGQWNNQFGACQIPYLRSPMFFHPDPVNVDGLVSYAHLAKRESSADLMEIKNVVGREYSKHQLKKLAKKNSMKSKAPVPSNIEGPNARNHDKPGIIDINMRDWKDFYRPSTPLFKDFCEDIINRYGLHNNVQKDEVISIEYKYINVVGGETGSFGQGFVVRTASGRTFGCKICIVSSGHRGVINYPIKPFDDPHFPEGSCHTTHLFTGKVNFLGQELMNKPRKSKSRSIVIVGGGLTSAQLAHVAANAGIENIYLLFRGPIKIKHFDFHLDWVTKYKNVKKSAFYIKDTDEERFQMIQDAREGGSINPEYYKKTMKHVKDGRLNFMKYTTIESQVWDSETKTWNLKLKTKVESKNSNTDTDTFEELELENVDYIYFATGIQQNIESLEFMQPIIKEHRIPIVRGFPCLTDDLQWNDKIPLFMIGKNASLRMGPSSANLDGARLGAERVGWFVQSELSLGTYDWKTSQKGDCQFCDHEITTRSNSLDDLDAKLDKLDIDSGASLEDDELDSGSVNFEAKDNRKKNTSFETRLLLASGQLNWFDLLGDE